MRRCVFQCLSNLWQEGGRDKEKGIRSGFGGTCEDSSDVGLTQGFSTGDSSMVSCPELVFVKVPFSTRTPPLPRDSDPSPVDSPPPSTRGGLRGGRLVRAGPLRVTLPQASRRDLPLSELPVVLRGVSNGPCLGSKLGGTK